MIKLLKKLKRRKSATADDRRQPPSTKWHEAADCLCIVTNIGDTAFGRTLAQTIAERLRSGPAAMLIVDTDATVLHKAEEALTAAK